MAQHQVSGDDFCRAGKQQKKTGFCPRGSIFQFFCTIFETRSGKAHGRRFANYFPISPLAGLNAVGQSAGESTITSGGFTDRLSGASPKVQPMHHAPPFRAVSTSTWLSPITTVSSGSAPASLISARNPSGSGFLVAKLLPP